MQTPKTQYIPIDSIEDLDLSKLSIGQLNNKYIDKDNNRYALKFNKENRKIEVVRIQMKSSGTPTSEKSKSEETAVKTEGLIKSKTRSLEEIMAEKKSIDSEEVTSENVEVLDEADVENTESDDDHDFDLSIDYKKETPGSKYNESFRTEGNFQIEEKNFLSEIIKEFEKNKDRISAMLNNLKNSKIFEVTGDPSENQNIIGNLSREIEVEIFQNMDKIINFYKELTSYPRPSGYYSSKYDKTKKDILSKTTSDKEIMALITRWEMQELLFPIHQKLKKLLKNILDIMNTKTDNHLKQLQYKEQQMFTDAKNAAIFMLQDIDSVLMKIEQWKIRSST